MPMTTILDLQYIVVICQSGLLISQQTHHDWQILQTQYPDYITSLGMWSWQAVIEFLAEEYPEYWQHWQSQLQPLILQTCQIVRLTTP